jgi:precorrin-6Y C5,15-methyltransferase (decarboxylating)
MIWLDIFGVSEAGLNSLSADQITQLTSARHIIAPDRHIAAVKQLRQDQPQAGDATVEIITWPSPFSRIYDMLARWRGEPTVILATGDPLWYGAGSSIVTRIPLNEMRIEPAVSGFQLAASQMGWPMAHVHAMTLHGRPVEMIRAAIMPSAHLLILADSADTPQQAAEQLIEMRAGAAKMTALAYIGGQQEARYDGTAYDWAKIPPQVADFHVLAVACPDYLEGFYPSAPGLADGAYESDGKLTKSDIRAITLARLKPVSGQLLWDLGCGSGSIGIEWMRAAAHARAIGVELRDDRLAVAKSNAIKLGVPKWAGVIGENMPLAAELEQPDAVFIGGGLSRDLAELVMRRLTSGGRLVVNAVTLESEAILLGLHHHHGGRLVRIAVSHAEPVGPYHGWRSAMPVTQWVWEKGTEK